MCTDTGMIFPGDRRGVILLTKGVEERTPEVKMEMVVSKSWRKRSGQQVQVYLSRAVWKV